jgi:hypothetical protein
MLLQRLQGWSLFGREKVLHRLAHSKSAARQRKPSPALALLQQHNARGKTPALSPAARALATKLKGGGTPKILDQKDVGLRASYSRGPAGAGGAAGATPLTGGGRPASAGRPGSSRAATPSLQLPREAGGKAVADVVRVPTGAGGTELPSQGLTDDLLQL